MDTRWAKRLHDAVIVDGAAGGLAWSSHFRRSSHAVRAGELRLRPMVKAIPDVALLRDRQDCVILRS